MVSVLIRASSLSLIQALIQLFPHLDLTNRLSTISHSNQSLNTLKKVKYAVGLMKEQESPSQNVIEVSSASHQAEFLYQEQTIFVSQSKKSREELLKKKKGDNRLQQLKRGQKRKN